jgi:hypothetical protein
MVLNHLKLYFVFQFNQPPNKTHLRMLASFAQHSLVVGRLQLSGHVIVN